MEIKQGLDAAICWATNMHKGQLDKEGLPYIYHPLHVAYRLRLGSMEEQIVAVLHDIVEDTDVCLKEIYVHFGEVIGDAIDAISRRKEDEKYLEYIQRCKLNPIAKKVKIFDLYHNIERCSMKEEYKSLKKRYMKAVEILSGVRNKEKKFKDTY